MEILPGQPVEKDPPLKKWIAKYEVDGAEYSLIFDTFDYENPEDRIRGMRESLELLGELGGIIPADSDDGPYTFDYPD